MERETPGEARTNLIKRMKEMRKKGNRFWEIAEILNYHEIPTFSGNGKWYAQTIHRLLKK